jgi:hypothetical protein
LRRVTPDVEFTPADRRGQGLTQIDLVVDPVPDQLYLIGQVALPDQGCQVEVLTGGGAGSGEPCRWRAGPRVEEEDVACFVGLDRRADLRRVVVDDGNRPVAGSGEGAQSLDLRGDDVTVVARLVHVEQAGIELDPQVPAHCVQRASRVGPHPLGATRIEPDEGGALQLEPPDHLEHAGMGTLRARRVLRRRRVAPGTSRGRPGEPSPEGRDGSEGFEVGGNRVDVGHLGAAEVIRPVYPVVVEESPTDGVPLVDDRAVDLEHDQQSVCRKGGRKAGKVPGQRQHPVLTSGHRREPYPDAVNSGLAVT